VSLSDEERGRLREIEALTVATDPQFAHRLDLVAAGRRRRRARVICWVLLTLGAWLMLTGVGAARSWISVGSVVCVAGFALVIWSAVAAHHLRTR
jgi:hypothetical protein